MGDTRWWSCSCCCHCTGALRSSRTSYPPPPAVQSPLGGSRHTARRPWGGVRDAYKSTCIYTYTQAHTDSLIQSSIHSFIPNSFHSNIAYHNYIMITLITYPYMTYTCMTALFRSLTTSFGSVCLGSLLVSLLQVLRFIVRAGRSRAQSEARYVDWSARI